jgi:hypothetical protein
VVRFLRATALAVDPFQNRYVVDAGTNELLKVAPSGRLLRKTGGPGWEDGSMDQPKDVAAMSGLDVYVADYGNHRVLRFDRDLNLQSSGTPSPGSDSPAPSFGYPKSVAATRFGDLLVVDGESNRVLSFPREGGEARLFGDLHGGKGALMAPVRIRVSGADAVYVQDSGRLVQYDVFGNYVRTIGKEILPALRTFAVDGKNLYVLDGCRIVVLDEGGRIRAQFPVSPGAGAPPCEAIVDFQIHHGSIMYLTARALWTASLPTIGE